MKKLSTLAVTGLLCALTSHASAQLPGDVGNLACREVQLDAQSAVSKRHSQCVANVKLDTCA
jgi:hypothetical protein